jgi:eukaryotic-like serine/threonine-protein kinase
MSETCSGPDLFNDLAHEFAERYRQGERPPLTEYTDRYPELAEQIRELFPALVVMEELGSAPGHVTGPFAPRPGEEGGPPEHLGEFRILREVARGGMGVVYEAVQETLGRHVALKVLPFQRLLHGNQLERFEREARSAARLHHTNIVPVFGVGEHEGVHYYAMQFIQGQSLDSVLGEVRHLRRRDATPAAQRANESPGLAASVAQGLMTGQFSERGPDAGKDKPEPPPTLKSPNEDALRTSVGTVSDAHGSTSAILSQPDAQYYRSVAGVGVQVAEALAYAHQQGILHRDIKPSNLLLDTQGTVWVTDFGLAKEEGTDNLTATGDLVGTLRYLAPERFQGCSEPRSDVYSLGLTLYEMLTLRPAFEACERVQLMQRILHEEPPRPRRLDGRIPRDLETIVLKAMAREPGQRYPSAVALAEDLRRFLADRPVLARRSPAWERTWRWCRRNPLVASLLPFVSLLLVTIAVGSSVGLLVLSEEQQATRDQLHRTAQAENQATLRLYDSLLAQAKAQRFSRRAGQRFESLKALAEVVKIAQELGLPEKRFLELRNEAIAALALPDIHITKEWDGFPPGSVWVELSDDFEWYVRTTEKGSCTVRRVANDEEVYHLPELGEPARANFGTGRILAVYAVSSGRFQLWDVSGDEPALRFEEHGVIHWRFRPDGRQVGIAHRDGSVSVYDVVAGQRTYRLAPNEIVRDLEVSLHPAEPFVALWSYRNRVVQIRDLRSGAVVASTWPPWPRGAGGGAWGPDGRTLLVADGNSGKIQQCTFDPAAPALVPTRIIQGPWVGGAAVVFHPAGGCFVTRGWNGAINLFDAVSGQLLFATHAQPSASECLLRFDRIGEHLGASRVGDRSDRIGLWSVTEGREYRALVHAAQGDKGPPSPPADQCGPAIHPGGRLAAIGLDQTICIFDLDTGRELHHLPISGNKQRNVNKQSYVLFDGTGNLLTNGYEGFFRWPVRPDSTSPGRLIVGPPERLPFNPGNGTISASHDGRVIAQAMFNGYRMEPYAGGWILHPNSPTPRCVAPGASMSWSSVSPCGHWVAFGRHTKGVRVFDADTGQRVWQSPASQDCFCRFSPNGNWLLTQVDGGRLYAVGTWKPGPQLGPGTPWDATSELAVLGQTNGVYRLVELASGRELARLEDPEQNTGPAAFTPDGTKLVAAAKNGLRVWDLRHIRKELVRLGLDWDAPPYRPTGEAAGSPSELALEVDFGNLKKAVPPLLTPEEKARQVIEHDRQALAENPDDPEACNQLAWTYLTVPAALRDVPAALPLAKKAVQLQPKNPTYRNTLGVAYYRTGRYREAAEILHINLQDSEDRLLAWDLYFLAMSHQQLGETAQARLYFDWAIRWSQKQTDLAAELAEDLAATHAEADALLRLQEPPPASGQDKLPGEDKRP